MIPAACADVLNNPHGLLPPKRQSPGAFQLIQPCRQLIQPKKIKGIAWCCRRGLNLFKPIPTKGSVCHCCYHLFAMGKMLNKVKALCDIALSTQGQKENMKAKGRWDKPTSKAAAISTTPKNSLLLQQQSQHHLGWRRP